MGKTVCIILNYNDAPTAIGLVRELAGSREIDEILVVDNHSSDGSWEELSALRGMPGVSLARTRENGGYGAGNQAGIHLAVERWDPEYVIIANPDIHVTDGCIRRVKEALAGTECAAVGSAMVRSPEGKRLFSYWDLLPFWRDLFDTGPVTRRLLKPWLITPLNRLPEGGTPGSRLVGAVPGSFFMLKMSAFPRKWGETVFDRKVFLYCEEKILARKLEKRGLGAVLATDAEYVHAHSVSIDKSTSGAAAKQKILHRSKLYYYRRYLGAGPVRMAAARIYLAAVYGEVWILSRVFRLKW